MRFVRARLGCVRCCALVAVLTRAWGADKRARAHVAHVPRMHATRRCAVALCIHSSSHSHASLGHEPRMLLARLRVACGCRECELTARAVYALGVVCCDSCEDDLSRARQLLSLGEAPGAGSYCQGMPSRSHQR